MKLKVENGNIVQSAKSLFALIAIVLIGSFVCVIAGQVEGLLKIKPLLLECLKTYTIAYAGIKIVNRFKPQKK